MPAFLTPEESAVLLRIPHGTDQRKPPAPVPIFATVHRHKWPNPGGIAADATYLL
jgi:hypothetical protein